MWKTAVAGGSHKSLDQAALLPRLRAMSEDVLTAVGSDDVDLSGPRRVGEDLVALHLTEPAALHRTVATLGEQLRCCADHPGGAERIGEVLGAVAAGFAEALRLRTLAEQERITA
ncbi:MAG: hypothetical protein ACRDO7_17975, partial [Nocardioidaceae bacterium]